MREQHENLIRGKDGDSVAPSSLGLALLSGDVYVFVLGAEI